jgi:hypothetical protein
MADSIEEYNEFLNKQADQYTKYLRAIFKEAADYHGRKCDTPYPLSVICAKDFLEHFMEDFSNLLERRQRKAVPEMERIEKRIKKNEEDILTHFFGPPFDPRNN